MAATLLCWVNVMLLCWVNIMLLCWVNVMLLCWVGVRIAGVYRGLWPTVFRNSLSIGLRFAMYGQINRMICAWRGSKIKGFWDPLFSGAFVGGITTILNNPIDVVKSRMQADSAGTGSGRMYKSTSHCIKAVFVEFGVLGFMSGLRARILKVSIGQAVIFFTYEHARTLVTRFI